MMAMFPAVSKLIWRNCKRKDEVLLVEKSAIVNFIQAQEDKISRLAEEESTGLGFAKQDQEACNDTVENEIKHMWLCARVQ